MSTATFRIWRGNSAGGAFRDYTTAVTAGMVVLDAVHRIQAEAANDLAVRWNCKAGRCGSGWSWRHSRMSLSGMVVVLASAPRVRALKMR